MSQTNRIEIDPEAGVLQPVTVGSTPTPTAKEIWDTLSQVDCTDHIEKKPGGKRVLSYLSWAWAWGMLMEHFPQAEYVVYDERKISTGVGENCTAEVSCSMAIGDVRRDMWLPVLDHKNAPITNPNAFQINTAKMRCLTKCISMFGLGHYIYAGEDLPPEPSLDQYKEMFADEIALIKEGIASDDPGLLAEAAEAYFVIMDQKARDATWVAERDGGPFTSQERSVIGSKEFREAHFGPAK